MAHAGLRAFAAEDGVAAVGVFAGPGVGGVAGGDEEGFEGGGAAADDAGIDFEDLKEEGQAGDPGAVVGGEVDGRDDVAGHCNEPGAVVCLLVRAAGDARCRRAGSLHET